MSLLLAAMDTRGGDTKFKRQTTAWGSSVSAVLGKMQWEMLPELEPVEKGLMRGHACSTRRIM